MFCVKCGTKNTDAVFCSSCGTPLDVAKNKSASKSSMASGPIGEIQAKAQEFFRKPYGKPAAIGGGITVVFLLALGSGVLSPNPLKTAYDTCDLGTVYGASLLDGDRTLIVDTKGEKELSGASLVDFLCVLAALETPSRITTRMDGTSALDGQQTDSANGITYFWKYHPNSGIQMTATLD
jgi:hypothetical protein